MEIKDIFVRPIDRSLEGVIKADALDDATVKQELDEYVVTDELKNTLPNSSVPMPIP